MIWVIYGWYAFGALAHTIAIVEGARGHAKKTEYTLPERRVMWGFINLVLLGVLTWLVSRVAA